MSKNNTLSIYGGTCSWFHESLIPVSLLWRFIKTVYCTRYGMSGLSEMCQTNDLHFA